MKSGGFDIHRLALRHFPLLEELITLYDGSPEKANKYAGSLAEQYEFGLHETKTFEVDYAFMANYEADERAPKHRKG